MTNLLLYKKIYQVLLTAEKKHFTADMLALSIGIYADVINDALSFFNPLVKLDTDFNLLELLPLLENHLGSNKNIKQKTHRQTMLNLPYASFSEFVYQKMTMAGMVDKSAELSTKDLKMAKKLISIELKNRKK
jgi:NADH/NAD ratio-sensing transcriptional regulator Rex